MLIKQARSPFIIHQLIACKSKRSLWRLKTTGKSSYLVGHCSRGLSVHCCADVCHLSRVPLQWSRQTNTFYKESICSFNLTSSRDDESWMNHKGRIHTQKSLEFHRDIATSSKVRKKMKKWDQRLIPKNKIYDEQLFLNCLGKEERGGGKGEASSVLRIKFNQGSLFKKPAKSAKMWEKRTTPTSAPF